MSQVNGLLCPQKEHVSEKESPVFPTDAKEKGFHWTQKATQQQ